MKYHVVQFPDVCELVMMEGPPSLRWLAKPLPIIVDFFIFWNHLGICCVYINFIADNFDQACHHFSPDTSLAKIHWELIITVVMIVLNQVKNLHFLSPFSSIGNILLTIGLGMVCYYIFRDGLDKPILRPGDVELFGKLYEVPLFMGTFLFASLGIGVLIALEDEMKTPSSYRKNPFGIFNMGFTTIIIIYLFVGVIGYYKYGQLVEGSITLNIPKDDPLAIIVRLIFAGVIIFTYPIHFYVSVNIFWTNYVRWRFDTTDSTQALKLWIYEFVIRCVLVIVSLLVTILVKQLSFLISIVGSFCLPLLGFLVPGLLELTINLSAKQSTPISILKDVFLIIFGLFFFLTGTFMGVVQVLQEE
ncbi:proton-coupled amino acid transporter-like protein CG1139 [Diaphorina citri]|uniref:Proton-coupled amino acid transporter-like protein CG1139 n=1 Tax=Diaphorina citri TaxID=121845 RepID=A0A1S3DC89_DIACI|nr:proton-coupled amino acid transporter-like protein CG1139 [Diaphorina citri]